jgi:hypothetical protein
LFLPTLWCFQLVKSSLYLSVNVTLKYFTSFVDSNLELNDWKAHQANRFSTGVVEQNQFLKSKRWNKMLTKLLLYMFLFIVNILFISSHDFDEWNLFSSIDFRETKKNHKCNYRREKCFKLKWKMFYRFACFLIFFAILWIGLDLWLFGCSFKSSFPIFLLMASYALFALVYRSFTIILNNNLIETSGYITTRAKASRASNSFPSKFEWFRCFTSSHWISSGNQLFKSWTALL